MRLKKSTTIFNEHPVLLIHPLLCVITFLLVIWVFPYVAVFKLLTQEWLSFVPVAFKASFAVFMFILALHYVVSFFRTTLIAAAVLRLQGNSRNMFDGFIAVLGAAKYFLIWVVFDLIFFPVWEFLMKRLDQIPHQVASDVGELAAWKVRDFAVPIMVFEKLMPHKAVKRALSLTEEKGCASLLGDLGWELIIIILFILGLVSPIVISSLYGTEAINGYFASLLFSYIACVWVFAVVNNAIRIAQIYVLEE